MPVIMRLIDEARGIMRSCGNVNQWIDGYPSQQTIALDIDHGHCYVLEDDGNIVASFAFIPGPEPTYKEIFYGQWLDDRPYYVVHRLASTAESASSHASLHYKPAKPPQCSSGPLPKGQRSATESHFLFAVLSKSE